jgi:y4mF family transcriptional regulator
VVDAAQIGAVIRLKRRSIGLRQADLAALSGVGPRFLSEVENGKDTAEIGKVLKVLRRLGLDLAIEPRTTRGGSSSATRGQRRVAPNRR